MGDFRHNNSWQFDISIPLRIYFTVGSIRRFYLGTASINSYAISFNLRYLYREKEKVEMGVG